jgi:predicted lysophospholipase L1 biosynthesis ABC-type transport system permease subunit
MGLGNSTAIDFPLYLYKASATVLAIPPPRIVTLDLWFCWATLALAALAALWAIAGSAVSGRGRWMLVIGGVVALISIIVFGVGLYNELSRTGSRLDLFNMVSSSWGTITTYLSFGFWAALLAAATMLSAAKRSSVTRAVPSVTVQPGAPGVAPVGHYVAELTRDAGPVSSKDDF